MNLFLLLTALLSALAGIGRPAAARATAIETSRMVVATPAVIQAMPRAIAARPNGYRPPAPLHLDLRIALDAARPIAPERRRE